jgi:hypothetical protein
VSRRRDEVGGRLRGLVGEWDGRDEDEGQGTGRRTEGQRRCEERRAQCRAHDGEQVKVELLVYSGCWDCLRMRVRLRARRLSLCFVFVVVDELRLGAAGVEPV